MKRVKQWTELGSLKQGSLLAYLTGIYMFAHYMEAAQRWEILQTIRFHFLFGLLLTVLCLMKISKGGQKKFPTTTVVKVSYTLIALYGLYTVFSMDREISSIVYPDRVVKFAMASFFIYASCDKAEDIRIVFLCILLAWLKIAQEGVLGWITGYQVWENQGIPRLHGSIPSMGHPNSFSGFAVGCLPFCVYLMEGVKHIGARLLLAALFIGAIIIVINTGSRTGYVAVIGGAAFHFYLMKGSLFKKAMIALLVVIATVQFLPDAYKERFESIFTGKEKEGASAETRKEIIDDAIEVFQTYPFGVGIGAFPKVRTEMFNRSQDTHNLYLEVLTNVGVIGFIVFLVFIKSLLSQIMQNIRRLSAQMKAREAAGEEVDLNIAFMFNLSKALLGFVLIRLFLGLFGMDMYEIYWWFALGFALAVNRVILLNDVKQNPVRTKGVRRPGVARASPEASA